MFKIKLMNYDATEYKVLEYDLQTLAAKGYRCAAINYITFFKKSPHKTNYKVDILYTTGGTRFARQQEKETWMGKYIDHEYIPIGHIKDVYVFQSEENQDVRIKKGKVAEYLSKKHQLKKILLVFIAAILSYIFVPGVFVTNNPAIYVTNGSIILHYLPLLICGLLLYRTVSTASRTMKLKRQDTISDTFVKKQRIQHTIYKYCIYVCALLLATGIILDTVNQSSKPFDDSVLRFENLGLTSDSTIDTYRTKNSIFIPYSYSYALTSNNDEEQVISVRYYQCKDNDTATAYMERILDTPSTISAKELTSVNNEPGTYLGISQTENIADTILIQKDDTLIIVATSFDLKDNNYQQTIIDFYKK